MFYSSGLSNELQELEEEAARLLNTSTQGILDGAKNRADALLREINASLNELGETLSEEESQIEKIIVERPIAAIASALVLGVVIGLMLRRH